jgi:peptidyl-tRNA hydrolase
MEENDDYTMYIIVNNDLNMGKGKLCSQVGHAVEMVTQRIMQNFYETNKTKEQIAKYIKYSNSGRKKIVLKASQQDLEIYAKESDAEYVIDAGRTQIPEGSLTAVAFLPSNNNKERFKNLKLL